MRDPRFGFAQARAYLRRLLRDEEAAGSNPATRPGHRPLAISLVAFFCSLSDYGRSDYDSDYGRQSAAGKTRSIASAPSTSAVDLLELAPRHGLGRATRIPDNPLSAGGIADGYLCNPAWRPGSGHATGMG
jgi:hypothetical protein